MSQPVSASRVDQESRNAGPGIAAVEACAVADAICLGEGLARVIGDRRAASDGVSHTRYECGELCYEACEPGDESGNDLATGGRRMD